MRKIVLAGNHDDFVTFKNRLWAADRDIINLVYVPHVDVLRGLSEDSKVIKLGNFRNHSHHDEILAYCQFNFEMRPMSEISVGTDMRSIQAMRDRPQTAVNARHRLGNGSLFGEGGLTIGNADVSVRPEPQWAVPSSVQHDQIRREATRMREDDARRRYDAAYEPRIQWSHSSDTTVGASLTREMIEDTMHRVRDNGFQPSQQIIVPDTQALRGISADYAYIDEPTSSPLTPAGRVQYAQDMIQAGMAQQLNYGRTDAEQTEEES